MLALLMSKTHVFEFVPDIVVRTSSTSRTVVNTEELGSGLTTFYKIDDGAFQTAGETFSIPEGDHEISLKIESSGATGMSFAPLSGILTEVSDWANYPLERIQFISCSKLTKVPDYLPVSIRDTTQMFDGCLTFNHPIGTWDMSRVTDTSYMFINCESLNQDLSAWNTSNIRIMTGTFRGCSAFNGDVSTWNTSKVEDMGYMFLGCSVFNQAIGNWDTGNVRNMESMLANCSAFNRAIGSWNTSKVTDMRFLLYYCTRFNQTIALWNVSNVLDITSLLERCTAFSQNLSTMVFKSTVLRDSFNTGTGNWKTAHYPKFTG